MPAFGTIELEFPSDPFFLYLIRKWTIDLAREIGFEGNSLDEIEMAVGEAASNSMEYGLGDTIKIILSFDSDKITIKIRDKGGPFDFKSRISIKPQDLVDHKSPRGYGLPLIQAFMDKLSYNHENGKGNILTMIKMRKKKSKSNDTCS